MNFRSEMRSLFLTLVLVSYATCSLGQPFTSIARVDGSAVAMVAAKGETACARTCALCRIADSLVALPESQG